MDITHFINSCSSGTSGDDDDQVSSKKSGVPLEILNCREVEQEQTKGRGCSGFLKDEGFPFFLPSFIIHSDIVLQSSSTMKIMSGACVQYFFTFFFSLSAAKHEDKIKSTSKMKHIKEDDDRVVEKEEYTLQFFAQKKWNWSGNLEEETL